MDFDKLIAAREKAREDKAELFDFYHDNWDELFQYAKGLVKRTYMIVHVGYEYNDNWYEPSGEIEIKEGYKNRDEALEVCKKLNDANQSWRTDANGDPADEYKVVETSVKHDAPIETADIVIHTRQPDTKALAREVMRQLRRSDRRGI